MKNHPHLSVLYSIYGRETQPFRKVHRMIDLFESIIKSHTVVILGEYVKHNKMSDAAKGMLALGLRTPSLGTWQLFSRVMFEELQADGYQWSFTDFPVEFAALDKALNADKTNVIAFRNGYAHGATPTDFQCEVDINRFDPYLKTLLESRWLTNTRLELREGKVWVVGDRAAVCVYPVLLHKPDGGEAAYAFFNDLKNDKVGLLNYPLSKHYREKEFFKEFHEFLPLHEWKKSGNNEFFQRIEELTETFKGRTLERETLLRFVHEKNKGYFSIQGNPGIGKSALIAQFFKDLRTQKEIKDVHVVEYFIRRGTIQAQIEYMFNYLIRRTDELFAPGKEIRAEGKAVWDLQQQLFSKWRLWGEHHAGKRLLFIIDGLDEGTENNIVTYLPRENFQGVLIIYGSRPGGHKTIDELWSQLPAEHHAKLELTGLSREDIRALIYDVANKYEVERESAWIDAVQQRSQGNPLYLKLLCDAIEHGSIALNDIQALPDKIDEYYKAILDRYAADLVDGDSLLSGLFTFAAARDYLTMAHLGLINKLGDATVQRIGSTLKEVLYENPLTEEVLDYQLFHESFREYLVKEKSLKVREAGERIIDFCARWSELEGTWEQRYTLQHYAAHAAASSREARATDLFTLMGNKDYYETQKKVLKQFDATKELFRLCLLKSSELKQADHQLTAALGLVDLKYEEANDAPQVVALVAAGDIDLALKRIESFGGADKEGVKRRFILYMLCLMELTLLGGKDKSSRKKGIEKLLNHLNEQIPPDTSIINWNDFFPSYTMFMMACEWAKLGLDFLVVYKRSTFWENDWLSEKDPYTDRDFEILFECARGISNGWQKSFALQGISGELAKQGKIDEALECAREIIDGREKSRALQGISGELFKQGKIEEAASAMQEALECAREIIGFEKSFALEGISGELAKQGKIDESLECARGISNEGVKSSALCGISGELSKQGKMEEGASVMLESLECARGISNEGAKSRALRDISGELARQGKIDEALEYAQVIRDGWEKSRALQGISGELARQGKTDEALVCARGIRGGRQKSRALLGISGELFKQGKIEEAASAMQEALECIRGISDDSQKSFALEDISGELAKQGKIDESLECAREISTAGVKSSALRDISGELSKQRKIDEAATVMQEALECGRGISDERIKTNALRDISGELARQGKIIESLECARGIRDGWEKSRALQEISGELAKQEKFDEAASAMQESLECARGISSGRQKSDALRGISGDLAKQGKIEEAASAMQEALECIRRISDDSQKSFALEGISGELAKQGKIDESLECAREISNEGVKSRALCGISGELSKQGKIDEAATAMQEALECGRGISDERIKTNALRGISGELTKQGKIEEATSAMQEALECAREISGSWEKSDALRGISVELAKQGKFDESLECARGISNDRRKSDALRDISCELAKQGKVEEALECAREISNKSYKGSALEYISVEVAKQGKWMVAENIGIEIPLLSERYSCWESIADSSCKQDGWNKALQQLDKFQSDEARLFYLKGWSEALNVQEVDKACVQEALSQLVHDSDSIENLLQKHAMYELFFGKPSKDLIGQLNKTLNIQWAMNIHTQFPSSMQIERLSTNVDEWIDEVADEDDRDDILGWAEKVKSGKMTEEKFEKNVKFKLSN